MNLPECLHSLCGYGIGFLSRDGRLVIQSAIYQPNDAQTACLKSHKPLLLSILPDDVGYTPGALLDALEAYAEREAIMSESGVSFTVIEPIATAQARSVLLAD